MSITEELRCYAGLRDSHTHATLRDIADRIDEAHERETREQYTKGYNNGLPDLGSLAEQGWVKLPKDTDGEYIHLGDEMHHTYDLPKFHYPVETLALTEEGWEVDGCTPTDLQHWKAPTVEDVLQEFRDVVQECQDTEDTVAEYARRIREAMGE